MAGYDQVPLGRAGTGEAAIVDSGNFGQFTEGILRRGDIDRAKKEQEVLELGKLLSQDVKSQWATDNINFIQPELDKLKKDALKTFKETKGIPNPIQRMQMQDKFNELKGTAALNDALYKEEQDRVKMLAADTMKEQGKSVFDIQQSKENRMKYNNPYAYPELKKEITEDYGGNINKWRAEQGHRFDNVKAFSVGDYIQENFKKHLSSDYERDAKGEPVTKANKFGGYYLQKTEKADINKLAGEVDTRFESGKYDDIKYREHYQSKVEELPIVFEKGRAPSIRTEGLTPEQIDEVGAYTNAFQNAYKGVTAMSPEKQKAAFAKLMAVEDASNFFGQKTSVETHNIPKTYLNMGEQKKKWTFTPGETTSVGYEDSPTGFMKGVQQEKQVKKPFIGVQSTGTEMDNKPIFIGESQVAPLGFERDEDNNWVMVGREIVKKPVIVMEGKENPKSVPLVKDGKPVFESVPETVKKPLSKKDDAARIAAYFGYESIDDFKKFLDQKNPVKKETAQERAARIAKGG